MSTFQDINPKENLISPTMLLLAVMTFLQGSASVKTNGVCIMGWQGNIYAEKQLHLSGFKHSCFDLLSLKFNLGLFCWFFFFPLDFLCESSSENIASALQEWSSSVILICQMQRP